MSVDARHQFVVQTSLEEGEGSACIEHGASCESASAVVCFEDYFAVDFDLHDQHQVVRLVEVGRRLHWFVLQVPLTVVAADRQVAADCAETEREAVVSNQTVRQHRVDYVRSVVSVYVSQSYCSTTPSIP